MEPTIVIIGAGAAGVLTAERLARWAPRLNLILIDDSEKPGPGVAYVTENPDHCLVGHPHEMGVHPGQPLDFLHWLHRRPGVDFSRVPRRLYGDYLGDLFRDRVQGPFGARFVYRRDRAVDVEREAGGRMRVRLRAGETLSADAVVLAFGNLHPSAPSAMSPRVLESPRWIGSPWDESALGKIRPGDHVGIFGAGLSMVDLLYSLKNHDGPVTVVSRRPSVFRVPEATSLAVDGLDELRAVDRASRFLRVARRIAKSHPGSWIDLLNAIVAESGELQMPLPRPARARLYRHLDYFARLRMLRAGRAQIEFVREFERTRDLRFVAGRLRSGDLDAGDRIRVTVVGSADTLVFDAVINATGPATRFASTEDPLMPNLMGRGLAIAGSSFRACRTDDESRVVSVSGEKGRLFIVNGLIRRPSLRAPPYTIAAILEQADIVARSIGQDFQLPL